MGFGITSASLKTHIYSRNKHLPHPFLANGAEPEKRKRPQWALYFAAFVVAGVGAFAFSYDVWVSRALESFPIRGEFRKLLALSEAFSHGFGVLLIITAAYLLDPNSRRRLPRIGTCAFGAGLAADFVKLFVTRTRPKHTDLETVLSPILDFTLPWLRSDWSHVAQSFPSAHTATTVGLAIGLGWAYGRGRYFFTLLAILAMLQRIVFGSHYLSDVAFGAVVALFVSGVCFDDRLLGHWFNRWEKNGEDRAAALRPPHDQTHPRAA